MDDKYSVVRKPMYFGKDAQLFGWFHYPKSAEMRDTAILICQPIALEYMSAYRSMRYMAEAFAKNGYPTLRFDYLGTGDSGGYTEDDRLVEDCVLSIEQAVQTLRELSGCQKICLIGLRLGASFAALYANQHQVDELILWAPVESGKRYLREIKALQMASAQSSANSDLLEAAGMVYWPNTQSKLKSMALTTLQPKAKVVTIIPRDDLAVTTTLLDAWQTLENATVQQLTLPGSQGMLLLAEDTIVPFEAFQLIVDELNTRCLPAANDINIASSESKMSTAGVEYNANYEFQRSHLVAEEFSFYDQSEQWFGVLSQGTASAKICLVIVNSGAIHRVGSNRMHVIMSRGYAAMGLPVFRMDIPGLGDSLTSNTELENQEHIEGSEEFLATAIEHLQQRYGFENFIVAGLSSGAFYAYNGLIRLLDKPIKDALVLNPEQFYNSKGRETNLAKQQSGWMYYRAQITNPEKWKKFFSGKVNYRYILSIVVNKFVNVFNRHKNKLKKQSNDIHTIKNDLSHDLNVIVTLDKSIHFVLSENDPANLILNTLAPVTVKRLISEQKIAKTLVPNADHTFSRYRPMLNMIEQTKQYLKRYLITD